MFHVGQRVKIKDGENTNIGTVTNVSKFPEYPIVVTYDNGYSETFTEDGRMYDWHTEVHLFPLEENSTFLQELKQILQRYHASIVAECSNGECRLNVTYSDKELSVEGPALDVNILNIYL